MSAFSALIFFSERKEYSHWWSGNREDYTSVFRQLHRFRTARYASFPQITGTTLTRMRSLGSRQISAGHIPSAQDTRIRRRGTNSGSAPPDRLRAPVRSATRHSRDGVVALGCPCFRVPPVQIAASPAVGSGLHLSESCKMIHIRGLVYPYPQL